MPNSGKSAGTRVKAFAVVGCAFLIGIFFTWALIEPQVRANAVGAGALAFLERPLLEFGDVSLSLLSLIKAGVFLVLLGLLAGRVRALAGAFLLRGSDYEPGQRHAIEKGVGYAVFVWVASSACNPQLST